MMKKSIDPTVIKLLEKTSKQGVETIWDRSDQQKARCGFGEQGLCCRACYMGPCRINPKGKGPQRGVCGATAEVMVARNFARMVAAGAAAHSDHGREVAITLLLAAESPDLGYTIKDVNKLKKVARAFGVEVKDRAKEDIAKDVAEKALQNFGRQEGELDFVRLAPEKRQNLWRQLGVAPRGIDREIVEMMHRTNMGVDHDYRNIMLHAARTALADGWGGSMIATELQDILFGTPSPIRGQVNLGVLSEKDVNIVVHGHEPVLSEMMVEAAKDKQLLAMAKSKGASGINLAGICCTANEILIRHGVPIAGNVLQQELSMSTGAVDAMIVDVQCIMPSLSEISKYYHTELITTSPKGRMVGVKYFPFSEKSAL
ncbi:MAG: carbon monoxide dehydrogenase, partial [Candidatus Aminicenantes bacterium]|nr:carbon monoxide dehydrogenase [Candidatus Aminicenantes bacterium]